MSNEIDPKLKARLDELKDVPARDPQVAARGRARFLAQAASTLAPVSKWEKVRHMGWILNPGKENFAVMKAVVVVVIALALLIGGTATVYAAQDDLPNEPLYGLKLFTENARLLANTDPDREVEMLMELVQTRLQEMTAMANEGETIPAQVALRLEQHIQQALQVAAGMDDAAMLGALERIRATLQEQDRLMEQAQERLMTQSQDQANEETSQVMLQTRETIESRLRLVEEGTIDPEGFRNTVRTEYELRTGQTETPADQQGNGAGGDEGTPGDPNGGQGTPAPGSGNGDGSCSDCTCTPIGSAVQHGTPTPGAGNGTPNATMTPEPQGSGGGGGNHP